MLLLGGIVAVGSSGLLVRLGLGGGLNALQLALWRLTVAGSVLLLWRALQTLTASRRLPEPLMSRQEKARLVLAGACLALHFVTWFASLNYVPIARSTLLVTTSPLWAGLLGVWIPALRVGRGFWSGLAVAIAGGFLVTTQGALHNGGMAFPASEIWKGDLLAMTGGLLVVPYLLLVQKAQATFGTMRAVTWAYVSAAACLWLIALPQGQWQLPPTLRAWTSVLGMALVPQLLGHTALNRSLRYFSASQVSTATLLEPVFAGILAWLLLKESITIGQMAGAALLLCGIAQTLRTRQPTASSPLPPTDICDL